MRTRGSLSTTLRGLFATVVLACVVLVTAPLAGAAAPASTLSVRSVDATNPDAVKVTFLWTGDATELSGMTLREDGAVQEVKDLTNLAKTEKRMGTVFVVDLSGSMGDDGTLSDVKKGINAVVGDLPDGDQMGIVSFNDEVVVETPLTNNPKDLKSAVGDMAAPRDGKTSIYDALRKASSLFDKHPKLQPNVVLVTDGADDVSRSSLSDATASVVGSGSALFAVELTHNDSVDSASINSIIGRTGGATFSAGKGAAVQSTFADLDRAMRSQYVATYESKASQGQVDISLSISDVTRKASYVSGANVQGAATSDVIPGPKPFGPAALRTKAGGLAALALVGLAVGLGAFAVVSLAGSTDTSLNAVLRPYSDAPAEGEEGDGALAQTALLQRAVELTEDFAERQGFLVKVERALERADLPLRAAEAMFFYGAGVILLTLGAVALGGIVTALFVLFAAGLVPPATLNFLASRRGKKFQTQLPDTLQLLSGSLRAGYSLLQGVEAVSKEVSEPMGKELRRVITEARLGRDVEDAMEAVADRMDSADFGWAVMAIRIQREVGGNLSELLLTVSDTMIHRERLRRDVAALTAEGKISAIILGLLPIGLGAFMWISNPIYMAPLGNTFLGKVLLGAATVSGLIGFAWMKKTITIKI